MPIHRSPGPTALPPGDVAFVVHLTVATEPVPRGRVEHLTTGRASHFESAGELVRFMRETLAALAGAPLPAVEDG